MPDKFKTKFGYSINPYLPLFSFKENNLVLQPADPGKFHYLLDNQDQTERLLNNFHEILRDGYAEYLGSLRN